MPIFANVILMLFLLGYGFANCYPDRPPIASMAMWFLAGMIAWHLVVSISFSTS